MPLSNVSDPVIREVRGLRARTKRLEIALLAVSSVLIICLGAALYLRSNDLESLAMKASTEQVRTCFRNANQRFNLRVLANDPQLSSLLRDFIQTAVANTPTIDDCKTLARQLQVSVPEVNG